MEAMNNTADDSGTGHENHDKTDLSHIRNPSESKYIYDTKGCNADNFEQYHLQDACRKETLAPAYQSAGDVDDASVDRLDVQVNDVNDQGETVEQVGTRPDAITEQSKNAEGYYINESKSENEAIANRLDVQIQKANNVNEAEGTDQSRPDTNIEQPRYSESCDQNKAETTAASDDECIRPYAAVYHEQDGETNGEQDAQPYAVTYIEQDEHHENQTPTGRSANNPQSENRVVTNDDYIRPYAVGYQRDAETNGDQEDVYDVQPYAVAYDEREGQHENQTPTGRSVNPQSVCGQPNASSESVDGKGDRLLPNPMYSENALRPNPMYGGNALRPNPMYGGNALRPNPMYGGNALRPNPMYGGNALRPNPMYAPNAAQPGAGEGKRNKVFERTKIVFGGEEPGKLSGPKAVVVSPSNAIFVLDTSKRQVQVYDMTGAYLYRLPDEEATKGVEVTDIAMDREHLWLVGNRDYSIRSGFVIRFTKTGQPLGEVLNPSFLNNSFYGIAVDTLRDHVIVTELWSGYSEVKVLHFNGSVARRFRTEPGLQYPGRVAVGREGNVFVSDYSSKQRVFAYNETGHYLFDFGGDDIGGGQEIEITDICTDSSGHVLVGTGPGGTVEMFTQDGRYVRRAAAGMFRADGVAVAPGGQLVVTSYENNTVTVFSHY
uniref:SMP-30/Gluconolactonase/LRE-like region domain-containing protein n=1 Tax=Branchiostoma floridae TaxID=7739 RepID=C3XR25_BRAFL|eukprot:XP_002613134.1 hypothetical protein BRAFLDRAFT_73038 [Branchiostoma floridae]